MPLKRIFASNPRKRLHQRAGSGLFSYPGGLSERKPKGSPEQLPRATEGRGRGALQILPFCLSNSKILLLLPCSVSEIPEETPSHPKK